MEDPARRTIVFMAAALWSLAATFEAQTASGDLESLYRAHQWFELRTAVTDRSPVLMRAAVATAFNNPAEAEKLLRNTTRSHTAIGRGRRGARHAVGDLSTLPVSINGQTEDFLLDTGAWQSAMTELEARKLGLAIRDGYFSC